MHFQYSKHHYFHLNLLYPCLHTPLFSRRKGWWVTERNTTKFRTINKMIPNTNKKASSFIVWSCRVFLVWHIFMFSFYIGQVNYKCYNEQGLLALGVGGGVWGGANGGYHGTSTVVGSSNIRRMSVEIQKDIFIAFYTILHEQSK